MPVDIQLNPEKRCIIYTLTEPFQLNELFEAYSIEKQYRDNTEHVLHSIVDMSHMKRIPPSWLTAKSGPGFNHPRSGTIIFVGLSVGFKIVIQTILKVIRYDRMKAFDTRAEANEYLDVLLVEATKPAEQAGS
jgi:hypothetical protein